MEISEMASNKSRKAQKVLHPIWSLDTFRPLRITGLYLQWYTILSVTAMDFIFPSYRFGSSAHPWNIHRAAGKAGKRICGSNRNVTLYFTQSEVNEVRWISFLFWPSNISETFGLRFKKIKWMIRKVKLNLQTLKKNNTVLEHNVHANYSALWSI